MLAADVSLVASGVGKGCTNDNMKDFLIGKGITPVEVEMLTKPDVINEVRTLTFRVAFKAADYESALKPEVWPYRVAVRHYKAPRRERPDGSWQGQSARSGGQINANNARGYNGGVSGQQRAGSVGNGQHSAAPGHLPPGHPGRVGQDQQLMEKINPGPVELRNFFTLLAGLNGEMGPPNQQNVH